MSSSTNNTRPHRLMRLDLWVNARRERRARKHGKVPVIVPSISYGGKGWVRLLGRTLLMSPTDRKFSSQDPAPFAAGQVRGWRSFTSVSAPKETVTVYNEGTEVARIATDTGGVLDAHISIDLPAGWHHITLETSSGDRAESPVFIVDAAETFGVVSDVDDTILNTVLPQPFVAAWNSFVRSEYARLATPGMPGLLDRIRRAHLASPIIYLSTGAWNVAPALIRFMHRHLCPRGPLLLTDWGPTHDRFFRSGRKHKETELRRLAQEFPDVKWLLIGDDGQHDEEIYLAFTQEHPESVAAVAIRQLTPGEAMLAGGRSKAEKHHAVSGVPWVYGGDGGSLYHQLKQINIL
ncbi:App1 family protein [Canibacter zhoujuaniae]|uniref:App1 family protein n=1 Tax=Canibacter zhoujuaniae TaxID=2708343 RepID=UPI001422E17C|nr:phosphatase domain-containing protein [Canibacter zhoujuaniae]